MQTANRRRLFLKVLAAYVVITLIVAWPLVASFGTRLPVDDGDPLFNTWVLAWGARALTSDPAGLFDANIFYPYDSPLAYSDLMLPPAVLAAPVNLLVDNPIVAYDLLVLLSFVFSATAMFLLVRLLTGSETVAFLAGLAYAFSAWRLAQLGHIQLLTDGLLVMTVYFAHRWLISRRLRDIAAGAGFLSLQALSGWYYGFYAALFLVTFFVFFLAAKTVRLDRRSLSHGLLLGAITGLVVGPFILPYLKLRAALPGFGRSLGEAVYFSAGLRDYLVAGNSGEHFLFPGLFALSGLAAAVIARYQGFQAGDDRVDRRLIKRFYLLLAATALILSLGPFFELAKTRISMPYLLAWQWLPGFKAMRVPARFGLLVTLALIIRAAFGWQELGAVYRGRFRAAKLARPGLLFLAALAVLGGAPVRPFSLSAPVPTGTAVPAVYRWLGRQAGKKIIELPSVSVKDGAVVGDFTADIRYLYYSTYHWNRLVNGYSGYTPPEYAQIIEALADWPGPTGLAVLKGLGVDYLVYHTGGDRRLAARLMRRAAALGGLGGVRRFDDDLVFEIKSARARPPRPAVTASLKAPVAVPSDAPVNIAWRVANTGKERLVVKPDEQPAAEYSWQGGGRGRARPRLPLVLEPGRQAWMYAQINGPSRPGRSTLAVKLASPLIKKSNYKVEVEVVAAMPVSVDGLELRGQFAGAFAPKRAVAGSKLTATVAVVNTGQALWTARFDPDSSLKIPFDQGEVSIAALWYGDGGKQAGKPQVFKLPHDIAPGQPYTARLLIDTPGAPGPYKLKFDLVVLGVVWFKDLGINNPSIQVSVEKTQ